MLSKEIIVIFECTKVTGHKFWKQKWPCSKMVWPHETWNLIYELRFVESFIMTQTTAIIDVGILTNFAHEAQKEWPLIDYLIIWPQVNGFITNIHVGADTSTITV